MRVLVVGEGGREHALIWAVARSRSVKKLYAAPGNQGMTDLATCVPLRSDDAEGIGRFAAEQHIDLTIVGPDGALAAGVVDAVQAHGLKAFGPTRAAAQLESSKAFAKSIMRELGLPTAAYETFSDAQDARTYVQRRGAPVVIKANGLAAGKGAVVCHTLDDALTALDEIMVRRVFGEAGERVVIEEFMEGEEVSVLCVCDGQTAIPLLPSQDHKQIFDGDKGPNTGGMGAYAPAPILDKAALAHINESIAIPVVQAMRIKGIPYRGILYIGLMMTRHGPKIVEFNSRFGDPETQVLVPLLNTDLVELALASCNGTLGAQSLNWRQGAATCVVLASKGYPGVYEKGKPITGMERLTEMKGVTAFHANTALINGQLVTNGGRVLGITAVADDLAASIRRAYDAAAAVSFDGCYYRRDVGHKAVQTEG